MNGAQRARVPVSQADRQGWPCKVHVLGVTAPRVSDSHLLASLLLL